MAIANLHETLMSYKLRRNQLNLEISELQSQKQLATYSQGDLAEWQITEKNAIRKHYKEVYEADQARGGAHLYDDIKNYEEIDDFEFEIDRLTAEYADKLAELTAWETAIDTQITTNSAELEEVNAYMESLKSMLTSNIQEDFNYRLNG